MVVLTSFTPPTDGIRHRQPHTTVFVNDNSLGKGTLFIAESRLSWVSDSGDGFSLEYPHISLHAISRDLTAFPQECLFLMLDAAVGDEEVNEEEEDENNENGSTEQDTTEMRLVPDDRGMLDAMFHAMNACQALHPDPEDSFSDEDFYEDADDEIPMEETDSRMAGLRIENMGGYRAVGREGGRGADTVGSVLGNAGGMMAGNGGDRAGGMLNTWEDRAGDMEAGRVGGNSVYRRGDMGQGDRSFSGGNMWPQNRMAHFPQPPESDTDLQEDSNFSDVEN